MADVAANVATIANSIMFTYHKFENNIKSSGICRRKI
jgi:hypothetical protein